jgi:hypothetical protein
MDHSYCTPSKVEFTVDENTVNQSESIPECKEEYSSSHKQSIQCSSKSIQKKGKSRCFTQSKGKSRCFTQSEIESQLRLRHLDRSRFIPSSIDLFSGELFCCICDHLLSNYQQCKWCQMNYCSDHLFWKSYCH